MMIISRVPIVIKALRQLGLTQVGLFGLYKLGLKAGYFKITGQSRKVLVKIHLPALFSLPSQQQILDVIGEDGKHALLVEADKIMDGEFRMFGGDFVDLELDFDQQLHHWTDYENNPKLLLPLYKQIPDIKFIWEPARFGWAFILGRAYHVTNDEKYAEAFWNFFEVFLSNNAVGQGPNWMSGQEVAIRLMALVWANQIFAQSSSSTDDRKMQLSQSVESHAVRIPSTLLYARSQNNNHLLTEAAGLYTASLALPDHPLAGKWRKLGQKWLNWCFENQVDATGEYIQHSTNYHRLMLQIALWVRALEQDLSWLSAQSLENLALAARWLADLTDPISGQAVNLGASDGALIFPLANGGYRDFRAVVQAAGRAFLQNDLVPLGVWDEMSFWFGLTICEPIPVSDPYLALIEPRLPILRQGQAWGFLRAAQVSSRPSHADSLHFDLWWRGLNIARDAGTYLYNAAPPWDNRLTSTLVHNTISVDGREQMTRAGRFLYLDWEPANANWGAGADLNRGEMELIAGHGAYGLRHHRSVIATESKWDILDHLFPLHSPSQEFPHRYYRLHWLLPDWEWEIDETNPDQSYDLQLKSPYGWVTVRVGYEYSSLDIYGGYFRVGLVRRGDLVWGDVVPDPIEGWYSPTYGSKLPTLSLSMVCKGPLPHNFTTEFIFPK